ncbi:MAG: hypothetical protein KJ606_14170 [Chloroflexi bacterium]|nr:hypothetical protein [Chloroflexota bacterium]
MKQIKYFFSVFLISNILAYILYFQRADLRGLLELEDNLLENLTALCFLAAGVLAAYLALREKTNRGWLIFVAALGFIGFLDEVGFGSRYFGFSTPVIADKPIDSIHDIPVALAKLVLRGWQEFPLPITLAVFAPLLVLTIVIWKHGKAILGSLIRHLKFPPLILLLLSSALIALAILLDADFIHLELLVVLEEMCELNAAIALIFCAWSLKQRTNDL